jgi:hypothetical protein
LGEIPEAAQRSYYVYLLDYGWEEELGEAVRKNLPLMMHRASQTDAVVIHGPRGVHFEDEVLSWHHVNGMAADEILPAILVTTRHPRTFRESFTRESRYEPSEDSLILIPLRKVCGSADDVVKLVAGIFEDIREKNGLSQFQIARALQKGSTRTLLDALILEPNLGGIGVDIKKLRNFFWRE